DISLTGPVNVLADLSMDNAENSTGSATANFTFASTGDASVNGAVSVLASLSALGGDGLGLLSSAASLNLCGEDSLTLGGSFDVNSQLAAHDAFSIVEDADLEIAGGDVTVDGNTRARAKVNANNVRSIVATADLGV